MEFYRCFICEVTLKDEKDFQDHLKQLSHLCSLEARKLISSEHVDMLILIDKFKLGSRQRQICEGAEKMPKISNQQSSNANNTPLPSNAIQDSTADIFVLSIKCILCCQSISSFTEFKQHLTEASTHTQLKGKNSPLLKIMKCEDCNLEFGETELCVHLIIVHFNIASAHLCSIAEGNRNFECIPCGTRIGTIKTGELKVRVTDTVEKIGSDRLLKQQARMERNHQQQQQTKTQHQQSSSSSKTLSGGHSSSSCPQDVSFSSKRIPMLRREASFSSTSRGILSVTGSLTFSDLEDESDSERQRKSSSNSSTGNAKCMGRTKSYEVFKPHELETASDMMGARHHVLHRIKSQPTLKSSQKSNERLIYRQLIRGKDVVVALTLSGHVKVWSLSHFDSKEMLLIPEEQSKSIRCVNTCHMTCCSTSHKLLLAVTETSWILYDLDDFVKLCDPMSPPGTSDVIFTAQTSMDSEDGVGLSGSRSPGQTWHRGEFLSSNKVAVWTKQGTCIIYQLPPELHPDNKMYRCNLDSPNACAPKVIATFNSCDEESEKNNEDFEYDTFGGTAGEGIAEHHTVGCTLLPEVVTTMGSSGGGCTVFASGSEEGLIIVHILTETTTAMVSQSALVYSKPIVIPRLTSSSLEKVWMQLRPSGLVEHLVDERGKSHKVTSSLYLTQYGNIACGREDGNIVLIPAIEHAALKLLAQQYTKQLGLPSYFVMQGGHFSKVTALLYPHQEAERYDRSIFISGGMDFSVVVWNLLTGNLIRRFVNHSGQIERLFVPPNTCSTRVKQCVVSVGADHSVNLISLSERRTMLIAGCHLFPVKTVKWRPSHDFMLVQTTDGTLYVWQLETGHLDRVIQGSEAKDILSACDEMEHEVSIRGNLRDAFRRRNVDALKDIALQQISDLTTLGANEATDKCQGDNGQTKVNFTGLNICPLRLSPKDAFFHVLFFDTEALIIELLACDRKRSNTPNLTASFRENTMTSSFNQVDFQRLEQVRKLTQSSPNFSDKFSKLGNKLLENVKEIASTGSPGEFQQQGQQVTPTFYDSMVRGELLGVENESSIEKDDEKDSRVAPEFDPAQQEAEQEQLTCEIAQLMISMLYAWDMDPNLDKSCLELLGLFRPNDFTCFGVSSRSGYLTLSLPGKARLSEKHWSLSSSVTTQHRLAIIALSNALMSMKVPIIAQRLLQKIEPAKYPEVFQGWSSVAALHCVLFSELAPRGFKAPDLEQLVRRWQDRCIEVREAAQALLLAELKRIGNKGCQRLLDMWAPHLPVIATDTTHQSIPYVMGVHPAPPVISSAGFYTQHQSPQYSPGMSGGSSAGGGAGRSESPTAYAGNEEDDYELLNSSITAGYSAPLQITMTSNLSRHEAQRRQGTAIMMLGVLGSEFGHSVSAGTSRSPVTHSKFTNSLEGFTGSNTSLARLTCQALVYLLLHPPGGAEKQHGELTRAAIHLLGRGFTVWEPYMDITRVILALLEIASDNQSKYEDLMSGLPLEPEMDSLQTTHYALTQIATSRPSVFITSLAREIARFSALIATAPSQGTLANIPSAVLARSKTEILRNIEILMDRQFKEVDNLLLETMDIVIHCLDAGLLKTKLLKELFPSTNKFLAVDQCATTRRVAAGGNRGMVHLFDSRALRPQIIQGPDDAKINCVCFSPDGKYLATFIAQMGKILFWQASSSFFNMIAANSFKLVKVAECPKLDVNSGASSALGGPTIRGRHFVTHRMVTILLSDGREFRFTL